MKGYFLNYGCGERGHGCGGSNGVAMIFFWGGPIFRDLRRPTTFGGGGVVAEIFRDRRKRKPGRFSGGGG